jgi:trehalose-6-phosphate synthase
LESKYIKSKCFTKGPVYQIIYAQAYQEVNEEFALKTIDALRQVHSRLLKEYHNNEDAMPIPVVWIHDYQLMLAAAMIRQVNIKHY